MWVKRGAEEVPGVNTEIGQEIERWGKKAPRQTARESLGWNLE